MIVLFGLLVIAISWCQIFMDYKYRHIRATIFVCMGLSGIIPAAHYSITKGVYKLITEDRFDLLITMAFLYIFGAVLYATRVPERFFPGKCDIWVRKKSV
uniref:Uncharacterized protein n=1 Tax=Acrobeloides nanus TaxID=290746 RepID=A0A914E5S1_9BILA